MGLTDWHSHIWEAEHLGPEFGPQLDMHYTHVPSHSGTPEAHRAAMERAGVEECIVIGLVSDHLGVRVPNDYVASYVSTWNGRAVGVASVDPNRASACDDLREAHELGLRGVKLAPPYQNFHPHSRDAYAVYETATSLGMFIIFHQGGVSHRRGVLEVAQPVLLDRVARDFPDTTIIVAHMGQPWHNEVVTLLRKHPRVIADLSARCARTNQLRRILKDANDYGLLPKLVWGSDFPTFDPKVHAEQLLEAAETSGGELPTPAELELLLSRPLSAVPGIVQ
ncbi:amidohydrolase family protein [Dactylosporangium roseum]|uniref:Amidohydrolase family protein n=2 Tax=Dactylosporangium roseum TaxID=47989 RepID=A0ABY5ZG44_9ACTN|nr:amidohydrolase family protein [Dactylosporangium roseum]UWZ39717.1 amidohydrolase family protein [Dactylosporangium roseum]